MKHKNVSIFGSTGSIGESALRVIKSMPDRFRVYSMAAQRNAGLLKKRMIEFKPKYICLADESAGIQLKNDCSMCGESAKILSNRDFYINKDILENTDIFIAAISGFAGLKSTLEILKAGKRIALANKEVLVSAGPIVMRLAKKYGSEIFPVDSEHSAIFQCLRKENSKSVKNIILTASGGPFYKTKPADMGGITVARALKHPNWNMGRKITIDSATLMNKGLEAIEAHYLFDVPMDKIKILIHPQSIVHSMVEFTDGSVLAQLSKPDMALPIRYALTYPERACSAEPGLDLAAIGKLEFIEPDFKKFPCLELALESAKKGGLFPVVLNAANEAAVFRFINGEIKFTDIPKIIEKVISKIKKNFLPSADDVFYFDGWARTLSERIKI